METIDQDPNDIVLQEPIKPKSDLPFKIATCVLAVTTIFFGALVLFNKPSETKKDGDKSESSESSSEGGSSEEKKDLTLKNFDIKIGKLVGAAGFNYGSILSIKTNADGTYMIGEVKNNNVIKFAYRALPDGEWSKANMLLSQDDEGQSEDTICMNIEKKVIELFSSYKTSDGKEVGCMFYPDIDETEDSTAVDGYMKTAAEALKEGLYKSAE